MESRTYHVAPSVYGAFAGLAAALFVLWVSIAWNAGAPWEPLALPPIAFGVFVLWTSRYRVTFGSRELVVATPRSGARRLACEEILSVEFAEPVGRRDSADVLSIRTSSGEELRLDVRLFPGEVVHRLLALGAGSRTAFTRAARAPRR